MEAKLNIAEILKDKPSGTNLYADAFGELSLERVKVNEENIICTRTKEGMFYSFYNNGKYNKNGEPILVPSKEMRDWCKFAWKKGDVLISNDYSKEVIFYDWYDDTYTNFYGKHRLDSEDKNNIKYNDAFLCTTGRYSLEDRDAAKTYINTIEERLGGKLNRETLEIEKKPEFKDGDIITITTQTGSNLIFIFRAEDVEKYYCHAFLYGKITIANNNSFCKKDFCTARRSTEEEQKQFFDALAKKGKAWDNKNKKVIDLKPKWTPKPFDKVLVRDGNDEIWEPAFFFRNRPELNVYKYQTVGGESRVYCIPYNEETAKLIGTSNDWKG